MKKFIKGYIAGLLTIILLTGTVLGATNAEQIEVFFNNINIAYNGDTVAKQGENYTLSNGSSVPYSILYEGTTYLPLRKISEIFDKEIEWDGTTYTANLADKETVDVPIPTNDEKKVELIGDIWVGNVKMSELPITVVAKNGMQLTINSIDARTTGVMMNITMKNNSTVSDKGDPMVSTWEFYDGFSTLEHQVSDDIFWDINYLRSGQEITGNVGFDGMSANAKTITLYGKLWQWIDTEEFKIIISLD